MDRFLRGVTGALAAAILAAACAGPGAFSNSRADGTPAQAPKVLRINAQREPASLLRPGTQGQMLALRIADAELTAIDEHGELVPILAAEAPSVERGTWVVAADGTMEVTWKLRSNILWQDGQPLNADDLVFGSEYMQHPGSVLPKLKWMPSVAQVTAPDATTLLVRFKQLEVAANVGHGGGSPLLRPIPRHLLGPLFASGDIDAFNNNSHWRDEFIGAGPFRLDRWEPGASMEFSRWGSFFLGTPAADRIVLRFIPDANALVASLLAGEADVYPDGLSAHQALDLERRWAGTGNRVLVGPNGHLSYLAPQFRPEVDVRPAALRERLVRQALLRALDRGAISEAAGFGLTPVADSWVPPDDPRRRIRGFRESILDYPYEPGQALRELEALGWRRGAAGDLANEAGERFEMEVRTTASSDNELALAAIGDSYRRIGVSVQQSVITPQLATDRQYRSLYLGMELTSNGWETVETFRFSTAQIGSPADRYAGFNKGGYSDPELDRLLHSLRITIVPGERAALVADMLRLTLTDLPFMPLHWNVDAVAVTGRVRNIAHPNSFGGQTSNIWRWDVVG